MSDLSASRNYASALFHLAKKAGAAVRVRGDLEGLVKLLDGSPELLAFLESPDIAQEEKKRLLERALSGKVHDSLLTFMFLVLKRDRVALLPEILSEFEKLDEEDRGVRRAEVVSAVPLSKDEKTLIVSKLRSITGKEILFRDRVDPEIIGGVVIYVDGDVIDGSIRAQLAELRATLLAVSVP
jgi:F-type H+-transporting ATPase subunit delta